MMRQFSPNCFYLSTYCCLPVWKRTHQYWEVSIKPVLGSLSPQLLEPETFQHTTLCSEKRKYYEWMFLNPSFSILRARAWSKAPDKYEDPKLALWELSSITLQQRSNLMLRSDCSLQSLFCYISRPQGSINYVAFICSICTGCLL